ncbi:MAG TPA: sugar transferase [Allosphingosinicella sp.]|jgi:lipopolysaccharide/colanic/teichoic acid biosynthesis glycosyltransferase
MQLGVGLLLAVLVPWAARVRIERAELDWIGLQNSLIGTFVAVVAGYYGFRRLSRYPGVRSSYHILPSFAGSFGLVLAVFFFARLDYSRIQFVASFALSVFWYYIVYFKLQRQQLLTIGVVPHGAVANLLAIKEVNWIRLTRDDPEPDRYPVIVADLRADIPDEWERFLADRALNGTLVMHVKQMEESLTGRVAIEHLSENTLGSLIPGIVFAKFKRVGDLITALIALPLLLPALAIVALWIRLDSPGPVLFRQQRMGYRGQPFTMYKFRSMRHGPAEADARTAAMTRDGDDRITTAGRILRQYRIDELPQLFNVIRGEMSWIGPRPEAVPLSLWYEKELPFYRYRHIVRPGITGWAQVKQGHVADVDEVLWKLHYDFYYIKNFSIWLDLLIIAGTVRTILSGFGAR